MERIGGKAASADVFGLNQTRAKQILDEVMTATGGWRQVATGNGIAARELTRMADAFDG